MKTQTFITPLADSILQTLLYYDLFSYPLTAEEVYRHLRTNHTTEKEVHSELEALREKSIVYHVEGFYSLQNSTSIGLRRVKGNTMAKEQMMIACQRAKIIFAFPFVRSVMISGSLSKGYADVDSDIDFFVITRSGRLWIARMLLVIFKRLFLLNSHKYFCVNYFISEDHLKLEERNLYTATELVTLIPMEGKQIHWQLLRENDWVRSYFPNLKFPELPGSDSQDSLFKQATERFLGWLAPDLLDQFFMKLTWRRWKKHYGQTYDPVEFRKAFRTSRGISKNHPQNYQKRVVHQYETKLGQLRNQFNTVKAAS